jgi:uncharacterized protein YceK
MKSNLTIAIAFSSILAGCSTVSQATNPPPGNPNASMVARDVNDVINDASDTATKYGAVAGAAVKQAATETADHAETLDRSAKNGLFEATDHVAGWFEPSKPKPPQLITASYCYHVYQDILCYRQPMPGWEARIAGYQPLNAAPPPPVVMQRMPKTLADAGELPATRAANVKPVFVQMPVSPAATDKAPEGSAPPSAAANPPDPMQQEQLPDPAMMPQL